MGATCTDWKGCRNRLRRRVAEPNWGGLKAYVRRIADELSLRDWAFRIEFEPPENADALASIEPCEGRKLATLWVCKDFWDKSAEEQRHTIAHEMIHCHHAPASDLIRLDVLKHMGQATYDVLLAAYKRQMEYCVDGLADALAPHLPLPEWGKES